jgi:hypothetical protein
MNQADSKPVGDGGAERREEREGWRSREKGGERRMEEQGEWRRAEVVIYEGMCDI